MVAEQARHGRGTLWRDLLNLSQPTPADKARVDAVLTLVGLEDVAATPVAALSLGHCRLVELGRALATEPRLLLADEPSSGLDVKETAALAATLRHIQRERGTSVLLVEHDLDMVAEVLADPLVRKAYLGKTA
jgi:branched-chain amino acid transport system ATP-binding protein